MSIYSDWEKKEFQHGWLVTSKNDINLWTFSPINELPKGRDACERFGVKLFDENDEPYTEWRVYVGTEDHRRDYALQKGLYYIER